MRGKNILWTSIATLIILSMMTTIGFAPPAASVEPTPGTVIGILPGEKITISLDIYNGVGISSWEVRLRWDPFALKMAGIAEGPYLADLDPSPYDTFFVYSLSKLGDTVLVGCLVLSDKTASGDGTLFTVTFQCMGSQSTKIAVEAKLFDIYVNLLPSNDKDVQVTPRTVAECIEAYPAYRRQSKAVNNTLYATIENRYTSAVTVYAQFNGLAMDGTLITLKSAKVSLDPGTSVTLSVNFHAAKYGVGEYSFEVRAWYSYAPLPGTLFYRAEKAKTTHFWVLP